MSWMGEGERGGRTPGLPQNAATHNPPERTPHARGDASAEFRLATFFPAPLTPAVDALAGVCDRARLAVGKRAPAPVTESTASTTATSKTDDAAAQRRRERGARALEERLKAKVSGKVVADVEAVAG